ncbi:hypothetical protein EYF80_055667 [Liparis tanakae]|uniref:Uncharacterized protein n=1 Tax=Liparis tanakae TaxID=230148 RepID=A0A4Z2F110_9TELE|nr:hypothetical protein EYF80_055667 [Liparis tanakae]
MQENMLHNPPAPPRGGKGEPHVFKEKTFKKRRQCSVCRQNLDNVGSFCRGKCVAVGGRRSVETERGGEPRSDPTLRAL